MYVCILYTMISFISLILFSTPLLHTVYNWNGSDWWETITTLDGVVNKEHWDPYCVFFWACERVLFIIMSKFHTICFISILAGYGQILFAFISILDDHLYTLVFVIFSLPWHANDRWRSSSESRRTDKITACIIILFLNNSWCLK